MLKIFSAHFNVYWQLEGFWKSKNHINHTITIIEKTVIMRKRIEKASNGMFVGSTPLESYYNIVKKTVQEYTLELMRHCRYKSLVSQTEDGTVLDDRSRLIDQYDACLIQDAHLQAVIETLFSHMLGERYMMAKQDNRGKWVRDVEESKKIQGTQFEKIIKEILYAQLYGYSVIEILPEKDPDTGLLKEVNSIERRNILISQRRIIQRQHQWFPGWDITAKTYRYNYIPIDTGGLGLFASTTPLVLAKKFTIANWVNFSHTYGQPIIHGKTPNESYEDRNRLAQEIANAAQKKVLVTGTDDSVDIKTFTMSNSEMIYKSLLEFTNMEISNLILGSESMAGATQSYVGSTKAHEDIFRARIKTYRRIVENAMNEQVLPALKYWGFINDDVFFKYSNQIDMSMENKIKLYDMLTNKYEMSAETIDTDFGITVGKQLNLIGETYGGDAIDMEGDGDHDNHIMSDQEYYKRYGHSRGGRANKPSTTKEDKDAPELAGESGDVNAKVNFLDEIR